MIYPLILLALFAFMVGLNIALTRFEKRLVWPYGEPESQCQADDVTGYGGRTVASATEQGFEFIGWVRDLKGAAYKVSYAILVSPDRDTIAIVGVGKILGMRAQTTSLLTTRTDRLHWVESTDNPAGVEPDAIGLGVMKLFAGAPFGRLWEKHQEVLRGIDAGVIRLGTKNPLGDFAAIRRERFEWLARNGVVEFTDLSNTAWRYTLGGAIRVSLKRQLTVLWLRRSGDKKPPG